MEHKPRSTAKASATWVCPESIAMRCAKVTAAMSLIAHECIHAALHASCRCHASELMRVGISIARPIATIEPLRRIWNPRVSYSCNVVMRWPRCAGRAKESSAFKFSELKRSCGAFGVFAAVSLDACSRLGRQTADGQARDEMRARREASGARPRWRIWRRAPCPRAWKSREASQNPIS